MYDVPGTDTGREWVEVQNGGSVPVDFSIWKFFEANVSHKVTAIGSSEIAPGSFAVIVDSAEKFKADNPDFPGQVFDSAFSLSADGEVLSVRTPEGVDSDSTTYDSMIGARGDGFSLQKTSDGRWVSAAPTPGSVTVATQSQSVPVVSKDAESEGSGDGTSSSPAQDSQANYSHDAQAIANTGGDQIDFEVTSGRTRLGLVDTALEFRAKVKKFSGATSTIEHQWSMGDGSLRHGALIDYSYKFPGTYTVVLNSSVKGDRAVSRVSVKIVEPNISVTEFNGDHVRVSNNGSLEVNLGGWSLQTDDIRMIVGADTIVSPGGSVNFSLVSPRRPGPRTFVSVVSPLGRVFAERHAGGEDVLIELPVGVTTESLYETILKFLNQHE